MKEHSFPEPWRQRRVVLCHDWLTGMRGGERVLEILCEGFPEAPVFTLIHNPAAISPAINAHPVNTSPLQHIPGIFRRYRYFLPLFPWAISRLHPAGAELLISASHCVAKGIRPAPGTRHLCYCFTPMRYAWSFYEEYFGDNRLKTLLTRPLLAALRMWDRRASRRVDHFVAISRHVQERIRQFYGREAGVVYPPVDTGLWTPDPDMNPGGAFDLAVSALVPYKRVDLAVRAYTRSGRPLKIIGAGTEADRLRAMAGPNIEFLGWQTDAQILKNYRQCRLLVFPGEEDFGIVPLEAQACGKPVVAYGRGGALETIVKNETGTFFHQQTEEALLAAVEKAATHPWNAQAIRRHAEKFGIDSFISGMEREIARCLDGSASHG